MMPGSPTYLLDDGVFAAGAGLPLSDRGFRYGMSVFETIAIRDRSSILVEEHLARLAHAAELARFRPSENWIETCREFLSPPPIEEGVGRIYVTAGDRDGDTSRIALLFEEMPIPTGLESRDAVTVEFVPALPYGKTGNYWPHLLAQPAGGAEAILYTPGGKILGGAMSNLFLIVDGTLLTPRHPVRHGVVAAWVHAEEAELTRDDLTRASAAFLTNSRIGLRNLATIDGRTLPGDPLVFTIWERYRREVLRAG